MERVAVIGPSGAGKSTLAAQLAERLDARLVELDALYHGPDWEPTPTPEFRERVTGELETERWVVAGNYSIAIDIIHGAADTIVWLDLPRWLVTWRVIRRSLRRVITGEELWNGNQERWRNLVNRDPDVNIVLWAWQHQPAHRRKYEALATTKLWDHATVHRLRTRDDVRQFLRDAA